MESASLSTGHCEITKGGKQKGRIGTALLAVVFGGVVYGSMNMARIISLSS